MTTQAHSQLFREIIRCDLAPGTWMKASDLSSRLGLGLSPIIQALSRLEEAGFVRPVKRKGWQVTPVTLQSVNDIMEAYTLVSPSVVSLIISNATDQQIATLRDLEVRWAPGHPAPLSDENFDSAPFAYFVEICGNPFMAEMMRGLSAHLERIMNFSLRQGNFTSGGYNHWRDALFEAISVRDRDAGTHAMVELCRVGGSELKRILQGTESLLSIPLHSNIDVNARATSR
ncbi:GntR family transcriptional regulator [Rhodococcus qingshengii]|nr:GntR family transcriptional regulator [Rhodococcus qingshengii]